MQLNAQTLSKHFKQVTLRPWTVPVVLLVLALLSFGLLLPQQGFYWDDWPSLLIHQLQGPEGFRLFFELDRPTTYISYVLLMPVLGVDPVRWQIFTLLLRWVTAVCLWGIVRKLWPDSEEIAAWSAILFVVSPLFKQQPIALTYHQLWMEYVFYLVSILAMVAAVRTTAQRRLSYALWTLLGVASLLGNFLISEYFLGIEFVRPVILWLAVRSKIKYPTTRRQLKAVLIHWLPYLLVLVGYLLWRFLFMRLPGEDRNEPTVLLELFSSPLQTIPMLLQMALQDILHILVSAWYDTLRPAIFDLGLRFNLISLGLTLVIALLTAGYLYTLRSPWSQVSFGQRPQENQCSSRWIMLVGLLIVLIGPLPGWATGRQVTVGAYSDRLVVPAMFGACMATSALIFWLIRTRPQQIIAFSLLVGLAAGYNLQIANDYRWARIQQNRFFWQLYWRAPSIEPQTAVMAYAEVLPKTGLYSTAAGINLIYADPSSSGELPYWFFSISREFGHRMYDLLNNSKLTETFRHFTYSGKSQDSLIVYYEPRDADCLRIVSPKDVDDPALQPLVAKAATVANLSRIRPEARPGRTPDTQIFGPEPEHGWCYLFQKADLAAQLNDWQQVVSLGEQAKEQGYSLANSQSNTPQEWLPFIEGYAMIGNWDEARKITQSTLEREPKMAPRLCETWEEIRDQAGQNETNPAQSVIAEIGCE